MPLKQIQVFNNGALYVQDDDDTGGTATAAVAAHAALIAGVHGIVARGCLDMAGGAWVGTHPGFENAVTDNGPGDFTVHLTADGAPATMVARCNPTNNRYISGPNGPLGGVGNRDLNVICATFIGADSNPGGWGAGAVLATPVDADSVVIIEVLSFA